MKNWENYFWERKNFTNFTIHQISLIMKNILTTTVSSILLCLSLSSFSVNNAITVHWGSFNGGEISKEKLLSLKDNPFEIGNNNPSTKIEKVSIFFVQAKKDAISVEIDGSKINDTVIKLMSQLNTKDVVRFEITYSDEKSVVHKEGFTAKII